jgi:DNA invertase Pin-like site-specific DNA recombinase
MSLRRLRCAIYTRKSTNEGLDQDFNSLDAQRDSCEAYVTSQAGEGWTVLKTRYDDGGFSGGSMDRPALQRLLADIRDRKVDVVVVYKIDRLTRALSDFARIVEILGGQGASFVSVTQAFNTTSSMGRLTLNVLLSFAQFEREVTAERIRDKIAAWKKKGMWMGGVVPLGYDVVDRKLVANLEETRTVRTLFELYKTLGTVRAVKEEADRLGLRTKTRKPNNGSRDGGGPFRTGHLHKLLTNCIYVGEIGHKGERYPGEHEPIIDRALWDAVQAQLANNSVKRRSGANTASASLLTGLLRDENGRRLKPSHANKSGRRYRYYVSREADDAVSSTAWRLPAPAIEELIVRSIRTYLDDGARLMETLGLTDLSADRLNDMLVQTARMTRRLETASRAEMRTLLLDTVERVDLQPDRVRIALSVKSIQTNLGIQDHPGSSDAQIAWLDIPVQLRRRGAELKLVVPGERAGTRNPDPTLVAAIAQGHRWFEALRSGTVPSIADLARRHGVHQADVSRVLPLAFLAPDIVEAILEGRQPVELTASRLKRTRLPHCWAGQRRALDFTD